jgi:ribulose-5-phosphate 4-epimerase/fuculose-1-phosphate aldolase
VSDLTDPVPTNTEDGRIAAALSGATPFPRVWPHPLPELTPQQRIALSARILADADCALDVAGHITEVRDDDTMWSTPYGKWWWELTASDQLIVDDGGDVVEGLWDVTPAIFIHTEIHRARPDAKVIIHNHPHYATLLATMKLMPEITDQQACMFDGEVAIFDEYTGGIDSAQGGQELAGAIGDATVVLLANHGLLVMGETVEEATYKFVTFERSCRLNYEALAAGHPGTIIPPDKRKQLKEMLLRYSTTYYFNGAARRVLASTPEVLD